MIWRSVTPFVGVWIEIKFLVLFIYLIKVTPFVGVWIEIIWYRLMHCTTSESLPSWECGLKFSWSVQLYQCLSCHSLRGSVDWNMALVASMVVEDVSLPSWECGLKLLTYGMAHTRIMVTPFVGVWIEIYWLRQECQIDLVTPFVGVWIEISVAQGYKSTPTVTPFVGVWIEINKTVLSALSFSVTPFVGVWIEITESMTKRRKA